MLTQVRPESAQFDALIAKLKKSGEGRCELLLEHLETAHAYLLGAMPKECAHNLQLAQKLLEALPATSVQTEVKHFVAGLLGGLQSSWHEADPPGSYSGPGAA